MKKNLLRPLLLALLVLVGGSAWAGDKTVVKYSFDDAMSPSLTAGSRVSFDYDKTSVITSTKFLNAWNNTNGDPGATTVSLGSTDLSGETWTLSFEWAACGGCNSKADHTTLKAGDTNLFDLTGNSNWNTTVTITYAGSDGTKTLPVPGCDKGKRFSAGTGDQYNTETYWHHIVVTGSASGVKMTITNSSTGNAVVEDVLLSETNVNPTSLIIEPCCGGAIGIDELSLTYLVEGEVIQTPTANYTAVNGIERTITATCDTEGATLYYSTDGENWTEGASITVSASGNVYFKAVKGNSESDVLTFAAVAGEAITLNAPTIVRSDNTTVTISADQTNLLLSPTATIKYTYGNETGEFTGSKTLTVAAEATITAYAEATGYTTSATSERAVALFPEYVNIVENTPTVTKGTNNFALSTETITVSEREYAALLLDDKQWGTNVYLQNLSINDPIVWGIRNGNWYINTTDPQWILIRNLKAGDIVVVDVTYPAADMVNATYSEKLSFGTKHAYIVNADGDVELDLRKINAKEMNYFYGVYSYSPMSDEEVAAIKAFQNAKTDLAAAIAEAKAIETEGKEGVEALQTAIATAEAALAAEDATTESLTAAKNALAEAVKAFEDANKPVLAIANADFSESTPIDNHLCGYGKDMAGNNTTYYGMQDVTGWNKVVVSGDDATAAYPNSGVAGAVFAYGSEWQMKGNSKAAPAAGPEGNTGNALGFFAVWGCGGYYYQDVILAAGTYTLTIPMYNQSGTQANESYTGFFVNDSDVKYTVAVNPAVGQWTLQSVTFTLEEETAGQIRLGYKSTGSGSGANAMLFIDGVRLQSELDAAIDAYNIALLAAQTAATDEYVTGVEKTALNEAIAANSNIDFTSLAAVKAATDALNLAVATFNEARAHYVAFANSKALVELNKWIYADAEKKTAVELAMRAVAGSADEAKTMNTALLQAYRAYIESNANAEGVEGAEVIADKIVNADASDGNNGWTISGKMNAPTNKESWTDANGKNDYMYFDGGNWGANSWDVNFAQDITLEAGKYVLSAIMRASTNVDLKLFAGTDSVKAEVIGAAGNVFDRGWNYSFVTFDVAAEGTVNIGARGITNNSHEWMSFSNFRLVRIEKPEFQPAYGTLWTEAQGSQVDENEFNYITLENKYFKDFAKVGDTIKVAISSVGNQPAGSRPRIVTTGTLKLKIDDAGETLNNIQQGTTSANLILTEDEIAKIQEGFDVVLSWKNMTVAQVDLIEEYTPFEPVDCTAKVNVNGWQSEIGSVGDYTKDVAQKEQYLTNTTTLGQVLYQTVEGLDNGTYTVEIIANASYTAGRGFTSAALDGEIGRVVVYAGDVEKTIPVVYQTAVGTNNIVTLENVVVTDGTLKMGLRKDIEGSNWHTIQIQKLMHESLEANADAAAQDEYWKGVAATVAAYEAYANVAGSEKAAIVAAETKAAAQAAIAPFYAAKAGYDALVEVINKGKSLEMDMSEAEALLTNAETTAAQAAEKAAELVHAVNLAYNTSKATEGADMTFVIVNPSFENGTTGWTYETSNDHGAKEVSNATYAMTNADGNYLFNIWSSGNQISQLIEDLPNGTYKLKAVAATDGGHQIQLNANDKSVKIDAVDKGTGIEGEVEFNVLDHKATIGAEGVDKYWYKVDNFRLTYVKGFDLDALIKAYDDALAEAQGVQGNMNADVKTALDDAIAAEVDKTNPDNLATVTAALVAATAAAKASVAAYANAAEVLPKMKELTESTNVYTEEAYEEYYSKWVVKYENNTLNTEEGNALQNPFLVTGWRANAVANTLLMSAWDETPMNWNSYHLNTWSTEGSTDGSNFVVPFIEYWTGDGESLAEKTLTATMNVDKKGYYDVTALVRVRVKNGVTDPATGITLQVNNGLLTEEGEDDNKVYDVTTGEQVGTTQFYLGEFTARGYVKDDLKLNIKFNVSADNNISWLAFKNVKFTYPQTVGINEVDTNVENNVKSIYNLNGQKVEKAKKGLYIINGKKVVIK